jgi:hypothetical protein
MRLTYALNRLTAIDQAFVDSARVFNGGVNCGVDSLVLASVRMKYFHPFLVQRVCFRLSREREDMA